ERALRYSPGYPLASAGIAHAQLGAGLYLSASLTLRTLFVDHPEMIDVTYGDDALPPHDRLVEVLQTVRTYVNDPEKEDHAGYALAMAYIGKQLNDRAAIEDALGILEKADPQSALTPVLKSVWLAPPDSSAKDAPKPGDAAKPAPAPMSQPEK